MTTIARKTCRPRAGGWERQFWALKCPHAEPLDLPERVSTDKDAARTSRRLAAKRARQAAKRRKNDKARRGFLAAGRGVVGAVALRRQELVATRRGPSGGVEGWAWLIPLKVLGRGAR